MTPITQVENIPLFEGRSVRVGELDLAIFNLGDRFAAIENKCPHRGGPLCDGIVSGTVVVCPLHGWRFDLNTGMPVRASAPDCVATFPARVQDGIVFVDLPDRTGVSTFRVVESGKMVAQALACETEASASVSPTGTEVPVAS